MIEAVPAFTPVTVNVPVALLAAMLTVGGKSTIPLLSAARATVTPPAGAGPFRVTVPVAVLLTPIVEGLKLIEIAG